MINLEELKEAIRNMRPKQKLYKVIKEELESLGRWKDHKNISTKKTNNT